MADKKPGLLGKLFRSEPKDDCCNVQIVEDNDPQETATPERPRPAPQPETNRR